MIIKNENSKLALIFSKNRRLVLRFSCFLALILALGIGSLFIPMMSYLNTFDKAYSTLRPGKTLLSNQYVKELTHYNRPFDLVLRYVNAFLSTPEKIHLNIKFEDYQKLHYRVFLARKRGTINKEDKAVEVNSKIIFQQKNYKATIRLRGTYLDHLQGSKWSFRIKLKNKKTIWGMNRFSIHHPGTRKYNVEWIYHKFQKHMGLISPKYKFAEVTLNGKSLGLYAVEEFFDKRIVESNDRREGVIIRDGWGAFQLKKVKTTPHLNKSYSLALSLAGAFAKKQIPASDYYDLDKTAKHFAITQLFDGHHSHITHNYMLYFNPLTARVEPIGFDTDSGGLLRVLGLNIEKRYQYYYKNYSATKKLYHDFGFFKKYIHYLVKYSDPKVLTEFLNIYGDEMREQVYYLLKERPLSRFRTDFLKDNQKYIREYLSKYISDFNKPIDDKTVLNIMKSHDITPSQVSLKKSLKVNPRFFMQQAPTFRNFSFIKTDESTKTITVKPGKHLLSTNLVIPEGYYFKINKGTTLELKNSAYILSYSPVIFKGSKNSPVKIISNIKSDSGLFISYTNARSHLEHVVFQNLTSPKHDGLSITGAVTFYEADVDIVNSTFDTNFRSDDFLNVVRSKFLISNSVFKNTFADAFDVDFGEGLLIKSTFINTGNDGLDCSGSEVKAENLRFHKIGDKAISIGEKTNSILENIDIDIANLGIASKDSSHILGKNISINNSKYAVTLFQKKSEFGFPSAELLNLKTTNIKLKRYLIEKGSTLSVNDEIIAARDKNVKKYLY